MYGYAVFAITVTPKGNASGPAQIDSLNGGNLTFDSVWRRYFQGRRSGNDLKTRRYWDTRGARVRRQPGSQAAWSTLDVRYGPSGVPGEVIDTIAGASMTTVRVDDATTHNYRHLLVCNPGQRVALLAAEVIGRMRAAPRILDAFRTDFERSYPQYVVDYETLADGQYWNSFLANAELIAVNVTRHHAIPGYTDRTGAGAEEIAVIKSRIEAAGRGRRLSRRLIPALLRHDVSVQEVFGLDYVPESASLVLRAEGQQKTISLDMGIDPAFIYPLGAEDRRDRPRTADFLTETTATLERLLQSYPD